MAICKASAATSVTKSDSGPAPEIDSVRVSESALASVAAVASVTEPDSKSDSGPAPEIDSEQSLETDSELVSEQDSEPLSTLESSASDSESEQELSIMKETQIY